ncbi:MAG: transposase [Bifidobacteriaceae bacterium]|jgi:transposase|nr:transposase [Bifidobacteriaceae bacterium]
MAYNFVGVDRDQPFLLPPSVADWLPADHLAWFVLDAVGRFDLSEFRAAYRADGRGGAAHDPSMMVALLLYSYCTGVVSSRKIEAACQVDVAYRVVTGNLVPDHTTVSRFRARFADRLAGLFTQILAMCAAAGLAKVGTVALDGTKMAAPASLGANRTKETIARQVRELLAAAEEQDAAEDAEFGEGVRGDELPAGLRGRADRLARLEAAKALLEAEQAAKAREHEERLAERARKEAESGKKLRGGKPKPPGEKASEKRKKPKANTTDPESRTMSTRNGWVQGYNAQAVADEGQVVLAAEVTQDANDQAQLHPMIAAVRAELDAAGIGDPVKVLLADAGYCSEVNLAGLGADGPDCYVAARNMRHGEPRAASRGPLPRDASLVDRMDRKVSRKKGRALYDKRKRIVEPVFGQIKAAQGVRGFSRRGLEAAKAEWKLIAASHNLLKLYRRAVGAA